MASSHILYVFRVCVFECVALCVFILQRETVSVSYCPPLHLDKPLTHHSLSLHPHRAAPQFSTHPRKHGVVVVTMQWLVSANMAMLTSHVASETHKMHKTSQQLSPHGALLHSRWQTPRASVLNSRGINIRVVIFSEYTAITIFLAPSNLELGKYEFTGLVPFLRPETEGLWVRGDGGCHQIASRYS